MDPADERLKEALAAGNIPITSKTLMTLREEIDNLKSAYPWLKFIRTEIRTHPKRLEELSRLRDALRITVRILDRDDGPLRGILFDEVSDDPGAENERESGEDGNRRVSSISVSLYSPDAGQRLVEHQRSLLIKAEAALKRRSAIKNPRGAPNSTETAMLVAMRDLFGKLTGKPKPAIAGPLHRFAMCCAELIGADGIVPEIEDVFRKRFRSQKGT